MLVEMEHLLFEFTIIILLTTAISLLSRKLRLPLVLSYILAGVAIAILGVENGSITHQFLEILSTLGVAFLLFLIGIELNLVELKEVGAPAVFAGVSQFLFTGISGFVLSHIFGFSAIQSVIIAISLTFSSTIIVVKMLNALGDIFSLYGRISIGIMLVQDFIAIFVLIFISLLKVESGIQANQALQLAGITLLKIALLGLITYLFVFAGKRVFGYVAKVSQQEESTELFLLATISWVLAFTFISTSLGLSLEIGAFLAGLSLSSTGFSMEIVAKIKPFRDFFIILFFVLLGTQIEVASFNGLILPIIIFSALVFFGNPFIVQLALKTLGFSQRTNFLSGITVSQIGEFSLIFAAGAHKAGLVSEEIVVLITLVAVLTITMSSYAVMNGELLFTYLKKPLSFISKPRRKRAQAAAADEWKDHVVLIGSGRIGKHLFDILIAESIPVMMIDYDPMMVSKLKKEVEVAAGDGWLAQKKQQNKPQKSQSDYIFPQVEIMYGDIGDTDLFDAVFMKEAKLVVSTINHFEDNLLIIKEAKTRSTATHVWVSANYEYEIDALYEVGADFVFWPHALTREYVGDKLQELLQAKKTYREKIHEKKSR
ncbi:cation:proton antiporter [candidate division WWE3 bacterium]|uniref:Cation:proton antiporter n=1 Tax=candidate division WWE3 bacterium TaxID=2053526 RepID=A0A955LHE1_UNCKA|nr:cation:proton antiporter [candidate division WWE3 bacterium]